MATHSSILSWKIPWTEEPWGCKESDTKHLSTQLAPRSVILPVMVDKLAWKPSQGNAKGNQITRMAVIRKRDKHSAGKDVEKLKSCTLLVGTQSCCFGKSGTYLKAKCAPANQVSNPTQRSLPKRIQNMGPYESLHANVHSSVIHKARSNPQTSLLMSDLC